VEREFPAGADELDDPVSRRQFMKLMSASLLLAGVGLTGCRRPEERVTPFSQQPENYLHGVPQYYATAMPIRGTAIPLLVKVVEGRPVKIEGNPEHPLNQAAGEGSAGQKHGATDLFAQASILGLYDPDRAQRFTHKGQTVSREKALDFLAQTARAVEATGGRGLCFLLERSSSPSRARLQTLIGEKLPLARWHVYEPVDFDIHRQAATLVYGKPVRPFFKLDQARRIVSLDCDFLGSEEEAYRFIWSFARGRRLEKPDDQMSRLYVVESLLSLTGANADHRLRVRPSDLPAVLAGLAQEIFRQLGWNDWAPNPPAEGRALWRNWVAGCAQDLLANQGRCLVMAGHRQPLAAHLLADALNHALGNVGKTVVFHPAEAPAAEPIESLATALRAKAIETLVILGGNPAYNAPADLDWTALRGQAKTVIRLGAYEDESFAAADWHLPMAHYLESWGDARTADGTVVPLQPLIEPLFGGLTELEVLARVASLPMAKPYDTVRETFKQLVNGAGSEVRSLGATGGASANQPAVQAAFEEAWHRFLHDGFLAGSAAQAVAVKLVPDTARQCREYLRELAGQAPARHAGSGQLEVVFARDYRLDDGRYANNGWLQELPDPITKLTWDNVILLSRQTAQELGLPQQLAEGSRQQAPVVRVELAGRAIEGPAWVQPGLADNVVGLLLGYGRPQAGRVGQGSGYNAYLLRTSQSPHLAAGAKLTLTGRTYPLGCTQTHWGMGGQPGAPLAGLAQQSQQARFASPKELPQPPAAQPLYRDPLDVPDAQGITPKQKALHWWGMTIDLNACVGCSTCVIACQSENNIPIVGKDQVSRRREMHWLRLDRHYVGPESDPQVVQEPMMCQHCEAAPCENVCPTNATVHDPEGLNLMVYNRCIGSRFCSNNCPYKARRFNFFDYHRRSLDQLYRSPLASFNEGEWELKRWLKNRDRGSRPQAEWDLLQLAMNPDVTVRMRGVMEKCTYCLQRIEQAKIAQKVKAGPTAPVAVPDGAVMTACQQACPAGAIVLGNLKDPNSQVSRLKAQDRGYALLESLGTKPRTTYLARRRNPNPAMPVSPC
jgi:molybdopterin-containing oxidoreductase family iron-sulfur binding subunit